MGAFETELRKFKNEVRQQIGDLKKIIVTRIVADKWVDQTVACALIGVKPRRLRDIRLHIDKNGNAAGSVAWKKGKGRGVWYLKADIEKYCSAHTIMN